AASAAAKASQRGGETRRTSRIPGESKPEPCPRTRRTVWYSHGESCSSISSWSVTKCAASWARRSRRSAFSYPPSRTQSVAVATSAHACFSHSSDDFVGQRQALAEGSGLRLPIEQGRRPAAIFNGPPGGGKTTLARIVAAITGAAFEELSAVSATVAQVREVIARARERLGGHGQRTILFLDEIHRFNKAQQDALLPAVEDGTITLIGATTENPYFEVNSALLSRVQIYTPEPHTHEDLLVVVHRG